MRFRGADEESRAHFAVNIGEIACLGRGVDDDMVGFKIFLSALEVYVPVHGQNV